jgi:hypothetical protein
MTFETPHSSIPSSRHPSDIFMLCLILGVELEAILQT